MEIEVNCPHCEGVAVFTSRRGRATGAGLLGRCRQCGSALRLEGGRLTTVDRRDPNADAEPSSPRSAWLRTLLAGGERDAALTSR